jgi:hypothetical protein
MINILVGVFNMFKCVKICFDDDYVFWYEIWDWICVLKYDIGNNGLGYVFVSFMRNCDFMMHWKSMRWHDDIWLREHEA